MGLEYVSRIERDKEYYINKSWKCSELMSLYKELEEAEEIIKNLKCDIMNQYNKSTQVVERMKVLAHREQNKWSNDKKVKIIVQAKKYYYYEGVEVANDFIHGDYKTFGFKEKAEAKEYARKLLNKYPGAVYENNTTYKNMEV